jgi:hypothetical protein
MNRTTLGSQVGLNCGGEHSIGLASEQNDDALRNLIRCGKIVKQRAVRSLFPFDMIEPIDQKDGSPSSRFPILMQLRQLFMKSSEELISIKTDQPARCPKVVPFERQNHIM